MSFDFSTLVTDRSPADLELLRDLLSTPMEDWTEEQLAEFNLAASKGAYNYTDLNRVIAAMDDINERLTAAGYVTGYHPIVVHPPRPPEPVGPLPEGYTQLEYIESSGGQYINTGYTMQSENMEVLIRFSYTGDHSGASIFGSERSARYSICPWGPPQLYVGQTTQIPMAYSPTINEICLLDVHANNGIVSDLWNNSQNGRHPYSGQLNQSDPVYIFCNDIAGQASQFAPIRLYYFKLLDNGDAVREYIPCKNQSGGVGLYDLTNGVFYGNSGGGAFSPGPEITAPAPAPEPEPELDPYTWYEGDIQTQMQMTRYLHNVSTLRAVLTLSDNAAEVTENMDGLTQQEANDIEDILLAIQAYLVAMQKFVLQSGMAWAISGGPGWYFGK